MTSKAFMNRGSLDNFSGNRTRGDSQKDEATSYQRRSNTSTHESTYSRSGGAEDSWRRGSNSGTGGNPPASSSSSSWERGSDRFRPGSSTFERGGNNYERRYENRPHPNQDTGDRGSRVSGRVDDPPRDRSRLTFIKRTTDSSTVKTPEEVMEEPPGRTNVMVESTDKTLSDQDPAVHADTSSHAFTGKGGMEDEAQDQPVNETDDGATPGKHHRYERRRRDLKVTNSRAAFLGDAPTPSRDIPRESENTGRRERRPDRENVYNTGPPPILNDRLAKLAEEERVKYDRERDDRKFVERGPPTVQQSSRFMKAIEADDTYMPPSSRGSSNISASQAPPAMIQNSRFAAASAENEAERLAEMRIREERRAAKEHQPVGPPPVPSNTRFAAAYAELEADRERNSREREERRSSGRPRDHPEHFNPSSGYEGQQGRFRQDRGARSDDNRPRYGKTQDVDPFPPLGPLISKKTEFIRPEMPKHLQDKKKPEPVLPPVSAPLALPGEDEEAARARLEKKKREAEEKALAEKKLQEELEAKKAAEQALAAEKAEKAAAVADDLLSVFSSGTMLGPDLTAWCKQQGSLLPSVDRLVFHMLLEREKKNPDPSCPWADKSQYGAALLSLARDDIQGQMGILWGIQKYCDKQGFPKIGGEYLVQAMFRAMYKYDLVDSEGFSEWKEDDSDDHEVGKLKSVVQTVEWFNWLEEEEGEDEEEEYDEDDD